MKMKITFLSTLLVVLAATTAFSQEKTIEKIKVDDNLTRYAINYNNSIPTLLGTDKTTIKYFVEKYVKVENDKKVDSYNLLLVMPKDLTRSHNSKVYVTVVFENYTIINARPTLENDGSFNGNITIPIYNIQRLTTVPIKSIVIKHSDESDKNDLVFNFNNAKVKGEITLMKDALKIKEAM
jgi:hypothetical protein